MTEHAGSFSEFYALHRSGLIRSVTSLTRCPLEAEEIAHEAFLALWTRWDRLGHVTDLEGYLYRTAMNAFRKRCRQRREEPALAPCPDELASVDTRHVVGSAVARLAGQQRRAVTLVDLLGYSPAEAAAMLGMEASTVRVHLSRARRHLRGTLAGV